MTEGVWERKKPILSGVTCPVLFQIVDKRTGEGFQPGTLLMSVYDLNIQTNQRYTRSFTASPPAGLVAEAVTVTTVNGQAEADVSAFVDAEGNVDLDLSVDDTEIVNPPAVWAIPYQRQVRFIWTWDSPAKTGKLTIVLNIMPDWATAAA